MSRQQLEAAYRGALDRQMLEQLDEPWDIKCESTDHGNSEHHSGPAAFLQIGRCEHANGFRCAKYVADYWGVFGGFGHCAICSNEPMYGTNTFIPLTEVKS